MGTGRVPTRLQIKPSHGFQGRTAERAVLRSRLRGAHDGTRQVVLVAGEPGGGKTALLAESARDASAAGATVLYGSFDEDRGLPYQAWSEVLKQLHAVVPHALDHGEHRGRSELARLVPSLDQGDGPSGPMPGSSPDVDRFQMFNAVAAALTGAAADAPLFVIIDDLHWADNQSLQLFKFLARLAGWHRLVMVGAYRDTEAAVDQPLGAMLADLRNEPDVHRVQLQGLSEVDITSLIDDRDAEPAPTTRELARTLLRESGGNPLFASELLLHLTETGAVGRTLDGAWALRGDRGLESSPENVREVIVHRAAALGPEAAAALTMAAVIGHEFSVDVLAAALDVHVDADALFDVLDGAERAKLIRSTGPGRYSFTHDLVARSLRDQLTQTRRAVSHRRVATAMEDLGIADAAVVAMAHHWIAAGEDTRAISYAHRAGDQALAALAADDAVHWYRRTIVLERARRAPDPHRVLSLLLALGEALRRLGDIEQSRAAFTEAAAAARELGDPAALATAALGYGMGSGGLNRNGGVDLLLLALLEEAIEALGTRSSVQRVRLLARLAEELCDTSDADRRQALSEQAVRDAEALDDTDALLVAWYGREHARIGPATAIEDRLAGTAALAEAAARRGDAEFTYQAHLLHHLALVEAGQMTEARAAVDAAGSLAEQLGMPTLRAWVSACRAMHAWIAGDFDGRSPRSARDDRGDLRRG